MNTAIVRFSGADVQAMATMLWQWDYGQILVIQGLHLPDGFEIHFTDKDTGTTTTSVGSVINGVASVEIPDIYLTSGSYIYAYIYLHATESDGETEYKIVIPVAKRPRPTHDTPTPVQQSEIEQVIAALGRDKDAAAQSAADAAESARQSAVSEAAAGNSEDNAAASERNAAASASNAANDASAAAESARLAALSETAAAGSAASALTSERNAYDSAERAEQAATTAGYMDVKIVDGNLIYIRTDAVDVDFELDDGHLIMEAI